MNFVPWLFLALQCWIPRCLLHVSISKILYTYYVIYRVMRNTCIELHAHNCSAMISMISTMWIIFKIMFSCTLYLFEFCTNFTNFEHFLSQFESSSCQVRWPIFPKPTTIFHLLIMHLLHFWMTVSRPIFAMPRISSTGVNFDLTFLLLPWLPQKQ